MLAYHGAMGESAASVVHVVMLLAHLIRDDPRTGVAPGVLLVSGVAAAVMLRRRTSRDFPSIR